jgi:hypothetical protein
MPDGRTIIKRVENGVLYSDGTILLRNVRASYPHLTAPYKGSEGDGEGKYSIVGLMPKNYVEAKNLVRDEINRIMKEHKIPALPAANKFLRDGSLRPDKPEMVDNYTVNASEKNPPKLRGLGRDPQTGRAKMLTIEEANRIFYPGCWVNVLIRPWWQDNKYGKKVNAGLVAVQFVRDDEPFGTGRITDEAVDETFDPIDDDDSGYDDEDDDL